MVSKRRRGREMAVQMLYQSDLGGSSLAQVLGNFDAMDYSQGAGKRKKGSESGGKQIAEAFDYARKLVEGTVENREAIDRLIRSQTENWRLERMPAVDRNILRLAVYELLFENDVPHLVVLDEAIELAKKFGSEQSGRFVNGLLDGLIKSRQLPGRMA
ncbi:MAG TPA: transcription antitermination factor NusB [Thermoanaerobaculia bacterium]|nr:transcription antitermination factor NusB [Thermoanaerobaculia bacterium]